MEIAFSLAHLMPVIYKLKDVDWGVHGHNVWLEYGGNACDVAEQMLNTLEYDLTGIQKIVKLSGAAGQVPMVTLDGRTASSLRELVLVYEKLSLKKEST